MHQCFMWIFLIPFRYAGSGILLFILLFTKKLFFDFAIFCPLVQINSLNWTGFFKSFSFLILFSNFKYFYTRIEYLSVSEITSNISCCYILRSSNPIIRCIVSRFQPSRNLDDNLNFLIKDTCKKLKPSKNLVNVSSKHWRPSISSWFFRLLSDSPFSYSY